MEGRDSTIDVFVSRRAGGLETREMAGGGPGYVSRRAGGLENYQVTQPRKHRVSRRAGGLESIST